MDELYESANIVQYNAPNMIHKSKLEEMAEEDGRFKRAIDWDLTLREPFATQISIYYDGICVPNFTLDKRTVDRISHGLGNLSEFAVLQKDQFRMNANAFLDAKEKVRVAFEIDRELDKAIHYLKPFEGHSNEVKHYLELTRNSMRDEIVQLELMLQYKATLKPNVIED